MPETSEPAEISFCASILAKAVNEKDERAFAGLHDALKEYLRNSRQSENILLAEAISKVEELAKKYTRLPVFVLENKIKWLESRGVRPLHYPPKLYTESTSNVHDQKTKQGDEKKERKVNHSEMKTSSDVNETDFHSTLTYYSFNDGQLSTAKNADANYFVPVPKSGEFSCSGAEAPLQNTIPKLKYEYIEMNDLSQDLTKKHDEQLLSNVGTSSLIKKKKNKKKKKKSRIKLSNTNRCGTCDSKFKEEPEIDTSGQVAVNVIVEREGLGKSSRNSRRRRFLQSKKELKSETSTDGICKDKKEELPELIKFEKKDTRGKRKPVSKKQTQARENDQKNVSRKLKMQNDLHDDPSNFEKKNQNSVTSVSKKGRNMTPCNRYTDVRKDGGQGISRAIPETLDKINAATRNSCSDAFRKARVVHSLDSAGGSIASSSEDNSSTSSSGAIECSINTDLGLFSYLPAPTYCTTTNFIAEEETKMGTFRDPHNVMHFGKHWGTASGKQLFFSEDTKSDCLKQTDVDKLLHNELGLEFFDQHTDGKISKLETDFENCDNPAPGKITFICDSEKCSGLSQNQSIKNKRKSSNEEIPAQSCEKITVNEDKSLNNNFVPAFDLKPPSQKFDHIAAIQFIWTEWTRIST